MLLEEHTKNKKIQTDLERHISKLLLCISIFSLILVILIRGLYLDINIGIIEFKFRLIGIIEKTETSVDKKPDTNIPISFIWKDHLTEKHGLKHIKI